MDQQISVIMPVYNEGKSIAIALDSILQQTYTNFEFIIVDDCSTDDTPSIIDSFEKKDKRIVSIRNQNNLGVSKSANLAIDMAKNEWIARMDGDDYSLPTRFEKQLQYLHEHPFVDVLSTGLIDITPENEVFGKRILPEHHNMLAWSTAWASPAFQGTTMIRKSKYLQASGYDPSQELEDIELWSRLIQISHFACLQEYLYHYRRTHQEYQSILENRGTATSEICRTFLHSVLDKEISDLEFENIRRAQFIQHHNNMTEVDVTNTNQMLLDLYAAMLQKNIFCNESLDEVNADLFRKIANISLQSINAAEEFKQFYSENIDDESLIKAFWKRKKIPNVLKALLFLIVNPIVFFNTIRGRFRK